MSTEPDFRKEDLILGQIAIRQGMVPAEVMEKAILQQKMLLASGTRKRLGEILLEGGHLTGSDLDSLLTYQEKVMLRCPECGALYNTETIDPGKRFMCRKCKTVLNVPDRRAEFQQAKTLLPPPTHVGPEIPDVLQAAYASLEGREIGGCRLEALIGKGGMGAVYRAEQISLQRTVAFKVLPEDVAEDENYIARFEREARSVAGLHHPNIVQVFDMGADSSGHYFIVMEYVDGITLGQRLATGERLREPDALEYIAAAADGLAEAHQAGVIHRDIKPDNIMVDDRDRVKIADFGLARDTEGSVGLTQSGTALGTPAFMSPEQGMGDVVDLRSDIYSLGATLYSLLAGAYPFVADSPVTMMLKHATDPIPRIRQWAPDVSQATEDLIVRAMAKKPAERFQTAEAFARAARAILEDATPAIPMIEEGPKSKTQRRTSSRRITEARARPPASRRSPPTRAPRKSTGPAWILLVAGAVLVAAVLGIVLFLVLSRRGKKEPPPVGPKKPPASRVEPAPTTPKPPDKVEPAPVQGSVRRALKALQSGRVERDLRVPEGEYDLERDVEVLGGATLEIEAGARLRFGPDAGLYSRGKLVVRGTEKKKVGFGPVSAGSTWLNVTLDGPSSSGSLIEHAEFSGGTGRDYPELGLKPSARIVPLAGLGKKSWAGGALACISGSELTIRSSDFFTCRASIMCGAIFAHRSRLVVSQSTFSGNGASVASCIGLFFSDMQLLDCRFQDNRARNAGVITAELNSDLTVRGGEFSGNETYGKGPTDGASAVRVLKSTFSLAGVRFHKCKSTGKGGAVYVGVGANGTVVDCRFEENAALGGGGGALAVGDSCVISVAGSHFQGNRALHGGAVFCGESELSLRDTKFKGNQAVGEGASGRGGAIFIQAGAKVEMEDVRLEGNRARLYAGGAMFDGCAEANLVRCHFLDNETLEVEEARRGGGGGAVWGNLGNPEGKLTVRDSTFIGNTSSTFGGGLRIYGLGKATVAGTKFHKNLAKKAGGGLDFVAAAGSVAVRLGDCEFVENRSETGGGLAAEVLKGKLELHLENCTLRDNETSRIGGGISVVVSQKSVDLNLDLNISGGSLTDNRAGSDGGGICLLVGSTARDVPGVRMKALVENLNLSKNRAVHFGGGLCASAVDGLRLRNVTMKGNSANCGGGLFVLSSPCAVEDSSIIENRSTDPDNRGGGISWSGSKPEVSLSTTLRDNKPEDVGEWKKKE
jgi:serine/threonine-protein kinase